MFTTDEHQSQEKQRATTSSYKLTRTHSTQLLFSSLVALFRHTHSPCPTSSFSACSKPFSSFSSSSFRRKSHQTYQLLPPPPPPPPSKTDFQHLQFPSPRVRVLTYYRYDEVIALSSCCDCYQVTYNIPPPDDLRPPLRVPPAGSQVHWRRCRDSGHELGYTRDDQCGGRVACNLTRCFFTAPPPSAASMTGAGTLPPAQHSLHVLLWRWWGQMRILTSSPSRARKLLLPGSATQYTPSPCQSYAVMGTRNTLI
jgi:hypothetical protein